MYTYNATLLYVHDGDTITVIMDLGFRISIETPIRFLGINAPELSTPEGIVARDYLKSLIGSNTQLLITSKKNPRDKYGRWLGDVYMTKNAISLNQQMIDSGNAVPFMV